MRSRWFTDAPAERLAALRLLIGGYALVYVALRAPELIALAQLPARQFEPTGVARVLGAPLPPAVAAALVVATIGWLAAFVAGARYRVTAPIAAAHLLWVLTYRSSWGVVFHTDNLLVLHVIALAVAPAADAWSLDRRRPPAAAGYGWAIQLLVALTAATYVLAAIAKLRLGGAAWLDGDVLRDQIAVDNVRKVLHGDPIGPLARLVLHHPGWLRGFCVLTLAIELAAPIALLGGRAARVWALGAWGFHVGVVLVMSIWFPYPLLGFAFLPLLHAERLVTWLIRQRL